MQKFCDVLSPWNLNWHQAFKKMPGKTCMWNFSCISNGVYMSEKLFRYLRTKDRYGSQSHSLIYSSFWPNDHCLYQIPSTTYNMKNMKKIYHIYSVSRFKYLFDWYNIPIPLELFLLILLIPPHDNVTKTFSSLLALFCGEFTGKRRIPLTKFSLMSAWTKSWANNRDADDLRLRHAHYHVTVMFLRSRKQQNKNYMRV